MLAVISTIVCAVIGVAIGMEIHPQPTPIDALFPLAGGILGYLGAVR